MKNCFRICLVALLVLSTALAYAEPVTLEYKYTVGEIDKYKMTMDMSMNMPGLSIGTEGSPMNMSMTITYTQKTLAVNPDGSAKVKMTYTSVSGLPGAAKGAKNANLTGQSIIMTMSKRGQTLSVEGMDKLLAQSGLKNMDFSSMFSSSSSQAILPEGPVEVGQSWSQNLQLPFAGSKMIVTSCLDSNDQRIWNQPAAKIKQAFFGELDLGAIMRTVVGSIGDAKQSAALSSISGVVNIDGQMTFLFGTAIGKLLKGDGTIQAKMNMNMPSEASRQGAPKTLQMSMNMRMSLTRTK